MTDVIGQLSAADPELGHATDPVRPPAELLASVMDGTDTAMLPSEIDLVASPRRRPRPWLAVFASFAAVLVFGAVAFLAINTKPSESDGDVASTPGVLITSEMILEDGVVTEAEYRAGAEAVVACLAEVGGDASVDYDEGGYAGFGVESGAGPLDEAGLSVVERCAETHLGDKVFFLRGVQRGEIVPEKKAAYETALFECVEDRTGRDLGEVSFDADGFPTPQGEQALQEALFAEEDHRSWEECQHGIEIDFLSGWLADNGLEHDLEAEDGLEVVERGGLTLTLSGALDNPCVEVRSATGMAGGCGADFTEPLNIAVGGIDGELFVDGWAPVGTAKVVVSLADGTEIEVTDLVVVEGFDVLFFLELLPPTANGEPELPIKATAFDQTGAITANFVLSGPDTP